MLPSCTSGSQLGSIDCECLSMCHSQSMLPSCEPEVQLAMHPNSGRWILCPLALQRQGGDRCVQRPIQMLSVSILRERFSQHMHFLSVWMLQATKLHLHSSVWRSLGRLRN